jgi:hypothetical protein
MSQTANPDKVSGPVVLGAGVGLAIAAAAKVALDLEVDPADAEAWWNFTSTVVLPALVGVGGWLGARRARRNVTPVTPDATPRDQAGRELRPVYRGQTANRPAEPPGPRPRE